MTITVYFNMYKKILFRKVKEIGLESTSCINGLGILLKIKYLFIQSSVCISWSIHKWAILVEQDVLCSLPKPISVLISWKLPLLLHTYALISSGAYCFRNKYSNIKQIYQYQRHVLIKCYFSTRMRSIL